jgi:hypothetical protein
MSEEVKSLEDLVRDWAGGDDEVYQDWIGQLKGKPNYIKTIEALEAVAQYQSTWDRFVDKFEPLLSSRMFEWRNRKSNKIFRWRDPFPLLQTEGSKWEYQTDPGFSGILRDAIQMHYDSWRQGIKDKQCHPLFLCLSGPGTGKSRLLNEFPRLVKESVSERDDLKILFDNALCFNVSFENGTLTNPSRFDPSTLIGTRMMYQLQDDLKWDQFCVEYSFTISTALAKTAELTKRDLKNMCVILCVDGMQKLEHELGSKSSQFYNAISAICAAINDSHSFVTAICSATVYNAVNEVLATSPQRRVILTPPAVNPELIFKATDELTLLLASDMGGHGRALEALASTLRTHNLRVVGFAAIELEVVSRIRMAYPDIVNHLNLLESFILHVIARKRASSLGSSELENLVNLGLFRLRGDLDLLEFPYILWLVWKSKMLPWANYNSWAPKEELDIFATWEEWEHLNCTFRIIKSRAFGGNRVNWMNIHGGAKFGLSCDEVVEERELQFKKCIGHLNTASKPVGKWIETDSCQHTGDTVGSCIQVGHHSPSGDSFLCLLSEKYGWIHEVHQDKNVIHDITYEQFCEEREKSASDQDFYIMFSTGRVDPKVLEIPRSAYVDASCWDQYYGPFAARAFFVKQRLPPLINEDDAGILRLIPGVGKAFADAIIEERSLDRFQDPSDAEVRLKKRKGLKQVEECVKRFRC